MLFRSGIDLESWEVKEMIQGLLPGSYAVSSEGRFLAWQEDAPEGRSHTLKVMDLEGEKERSIKGEGQECLKPIGFVESDFVYGIARAEHEPELHGVYHRDPGFHQKSRDIQEQVRVKYRLPVAEAVKGKAV